jgi:purine-binding chemotaxis protein CheW
MGESISKLDRKQFVTFKLNGEIYGVDIDSIDNITRLQQLISAPNASKHCCGIINVRDSLIPVFSARTKMGLAYDDYSDATRIIIIKAENNTLVGVIVDEVLEIMAPDEEIVSPFKSTQDNSESNFVYGITKVKESQISLIDFQKLFSEDIKY